MAKRPHKLFDRLAGGLGYGPANNEGCGCWAVFILISLVPVFVGNFVGEQLESELPLLVGWLIWGAMFFAFMRFAKRHS